MLRGAPRWRRLERVRARRGHRRGARGARAGSRAVDRQRGQAAAAGRGARAIEEGDLDPAALLTRTEADRVADSGLWQDLGVDALPAADVAALVGAHSDNLATNVLVRRVGLEAVAATAAALGLRRTALHDRVRGARDGADPERLASGTAGELSRLLADLAAGRTAAPGLVLGWLSRNADLSQVAAALGLDPPPTWPETTRAAPKAARPSCIGTSAPELERAPKVGALPLIAS